VQNRPAVSVALVKNLHFPEFFLVKRNPELRFFGDYYAFPGGVLEPADSEIRITGPAVYPEESAPYIAAAAREVFEETGVLLATAPKPLSRDKLGNYRQALLREEITFPDILTAEGLTVSAEPFRFLGEILTPEFAPVRYDTKFFLAELPETQMPSIITGELVAGHFYTPARAIALWKDGEIDIVPPVVFMLLQMMNLPLEPALERILQDTQGYKAGKIHRIYFSPGICMAPLLTKPVPPATHTNCYIIGEKQMYVLDPGASEPEEQERLLTYLDSLVDEEHKFEAILLSHHHPDHTDGAALCRSRYGIPIYAHPYTAGKLPDFQFGRLLKHGDELDLGQAPDGKGGWKIKVLYTPGHAQGHLAFQENRYGALLVGDMISTLSSILVDPEDGGDMIEYESSLNLLLESAPGTVYPAHGPAVKEGKKLIRLYIEHRQRRELKILQALGSAPKTLAELVQQVYDDVEPAIRPFAEKSLRAVLTKLIKQNKCKKRNDGYSLKI
jgi:glyoxylase-like metal-dependent hydrolase (beta-lactamase superfamily II)